MWDLTSAVRRNYPTRRRLENAKEPRIYDNWYGELRRQDKDKGETGYHDHSTR
jgi:hypothetical protein